MDEKIFVNTIQTKPFQLAPVEIIIPFMDEHAKVLNLMTDIFNSISSNRYLITLVDDGSLNQNFVQQLKSKKIPGVRFLNHKQNRGFGASINTALKTPFPNYLPYVLIMHSDVRLKDVSWLFNLGTTLQKMKQQGTKMVSPLTNNPIDCVEQLKGNYGDKSDDRVIKDGFLPMYCALAHRQLFDRVGPFAECPYAGTETEEYAWRMKKNGFTQGICGSSWVEHEGQGTMKKFKKNKRVQDLLRKTHEEFEQKIKTNNTNNK